MANRTLPQEIDHYVQLGLTPIPLEPRSKEPLLKWGNGRSPMLQDLVISSVVDRLARVEILTRRFPTGEMVSVQSKDNRRHHFREYRRSDGLARPYKAKVDLVLGDSWIDLAEPED